MNGDVAPATINKLRSVVSLLASQATGDAPVKPFFATLFEVFGAKNLDDLVKNDFGTRWYNDRWIEIVEHGDESGELFERTDGVRCRFAIVFLSMWKKALLRARDDLTDVEKLWGQDFAQMNSAYDSLMHTEIKLGVAKSGGGSSNA